MSNVTNFSSSSTGLEDLFNESVNTNDIFFAYAATISAAMTVLAMVTIVYYFAVGRREFGYWENFIVSLLAFVAIQSLIESMISPHNVSHHLSFWAAIVAVAGMQLLLIRLPALFIVFAVIGCLALATYFFGSVMAKLVALGVSAVVMFIGGLLLVGLVAIYKKKFLMAAKLAVMSALSSLVIVLCYLFYINFDFQQFELKADNVMSVLMLSSPGSSLYLHLAAVGLLFSARIMAMWAWDWYQSKKAKEEEEGEDEEVGDHELVVTADDTTGKEHKEAVAMTAINAVTESQPLVDAKVVDKVGTSSEPKPAASTPVTLTVINAKSGVSSPRPHSSRREKQTGKNTRSIPLNTSGARLLFLK